MKKLLRVATPFAALGLGLALSGCDGAISVGEHDGVPLSDLDTGGAAPSKLVLASPDRVIVKEGDELDIEVSGYPDTVKALRFNLEDGTLGIMREKGFKEKGRAIITVTMPPARQFVLAGSGAIEAPVLVEKAEVDIAGSGTVSIAKVAATRLDVNLMGSGTMTAAGTAERLDFNVAGSGKLAARGLRVERADVNIAGSGSGEFASDGRVDANVAGSGEVTVYGRANCKISAFGSGKLHCRDGGSEWNGEAPGPPPPPVAPRALAAPEAPEPPAPAE